MAKTFILIRKILAQMLFASAQVSFFISGMKGILKQRAIGAGM